MASWVSEKKQSRPRGVFRRWIHNRRRGTVRAGEAPVIAAAAPDARPKRQTP